MELIIDFYKSLDTLNLIIFWGIIIVIILLLIFSCILINKNKKLKKLIEDTNKEEELPIKKDNLLKEEIASIPEEKEIILPPIPEIPQEKETVDKPIETEKKFIAEEHVMEYNKDLFSLSNIKKNNELEKTTTEPLYKKEFEMPTGPYQRNVLREMSLSQTSPIGINRQVTKEDKKLEIAKDLEESLNNEQQEVNTKKEEPTKTINKEVVQNHSPKINNQIKSELTNIENILPRRTEIINENTLKNEIKYEERKRENQVMSKSNYEKKDEIKELTYPSSKIINQNNLNSQNNEIQIKLNKEESKTESPANYKVDYETKKEEIQPLTSSSMNDNLISKPTRELLNSVPPIKETKSIKSSSEKYLEEVSKKLAEAEITDEIERTNYELEQEENAIISYKELMEKKDSIQTIDEEEAIISIEELMNRNNQQQENKENNKLYNLSEEEENDNFIKELKQFRNDL